MRPGDGPAQVGRLSVGAVNRATLVVLFAVGAGVAAQPIERALAPAPRVDADGVPLPPGVLARMGSGCLRHADGSIEFAPDGKSLAAVGADAVRIWDTAAGKLLGRIPHLSLGFFDSGMAPPAPVVRYSTDGKDLVLITGGGQMIDVASVNLITGRRVQRHVLQTGRGSSLRDHVSRSGKRAVDVDNSHGTIHLVDLVAGRKTTAVPIRGESVQHLAFSPDDTTLAVANRQDTLRLYDTTSGAQTAVLTRDQAKFYFVTFAPDGRTLATIAAPGPGEAVYGVDLWDIPTRQLKRGLAADGLRLPERAEFSADGRTLAVGGSDSDVFLFDVATGRELRRLHTSPVRGFAFAPDSRTLAVASISGTITLWDVATGQPKPASADPTTGIYLLAFADGGRKLVGTGYSAIAWDPATGRELRRYPVEGGLSPDGRWIAARAGAGIRLYDADTGREVRTLVGDKPGFGIFVFTPDSRRIIATDADNAIAVWDVDRGTLLKRLTSHRAALSHLAVSPDSRWLASASQYDSVHGDFDIRLWDLNADQVVRRITPRNGSAHAALFTPDGRTLVSAAWPGQPDDGGTVQLWDVATGRELSSFAIKTPWATRATLSPDGRTLATGGHDKQIHLWEIAGGGERRTFVGHAGDVRALAFAPDGRTLAAASDEAPVYLWDVFGPAPAEPLDAADLAQAWTDLAGQNARAAFEGLRRLVTAPDQAVPFLAQRLEPAAVVSAEQVQTWIRQLDSDKFAERRRAATELAKLGDRAQAALRAILSATPSPEVRQAVQGLLDRIEAGAPEVPRAVEALEYIGTPAARRHLRALAGGAAGVAVTDAAAAALRRLESRQGLSPRRPLAGQRVRG
jgi:WD40 repeat protein